jgi:plastocyanin
MKRVAVAFYALLFGTSLYAGATIEGVVQKAAGAKSAATTTGRYKPTADPVGKPDPIRAAIYLEGDFPKTNATTKAEVGQKHYQFAPGLLVVQKGTEIAFPNYDKEFHNVFSLSKPKRLDLGNYRKDQEPPVILFDKPGVVDLYCKIHSHMRGTILVVETPYYTQTVPQTGAFKLENLPPGKHVLKMWLSKEVYAEQPVELKEGETVKVDFK